jgi:hypothetical protein
MNSTSEKIVLLFIIAVAATACRKNIVVNHKQSILFEFEFINYAMNYQHYGFFIDSEGDVLAYNNPENWNFPDRELRIGENQVTENIAMCTRTGIRIPEEELRKFSNHIKNISASKVSALRNVSDNEGSTEFICYQYIENSGMYKGTIIKMEGDFTCENLNFFSRKMAEWMKGIKDRVASK